VRLWDAVARSLVSELTDDSRSIPLVAFSSDGQQLASGSRNKIQLWDMRSVESRIAPQKDVKFIDMKPYSPDGLSILSHNDNRTVLQWDHLSGMAGSTVCCLRLPGRPPWCRTPMIGIGS